MVATAEDAKKAAAAAPSKKGGKDQQKEPHPDDDLSDEDLELKRELEALVERVAAATASTRPTADSAAVLAAAKQLCDKIRTATASMTSVPKPLKFLRPHAQALKAHWSKLPAEGKAAAGAAADARRALADVVSVLCSTGAPRNAPGGPARHARLRECLRFRVAGTRDDVGAWGHEYLRHLAGEIAAEFCALREREEEAEAGGKPQDAAAAEAEAAALDEADLERAEAGEDGEAGGEAGKDGGKAGGVDAAADGDKKPKASEGGGGGEGALADGDKKDGGGDKKGGKKGALAAEPEKKKMTPEERVVWLSEQRAIRAALPVVKMADIMALVEQVRAE